MRALGEQAAAEADAAHIGALEVCGARHRALEVGAVEVRAAEVALADVGVVEVGAGQRGVLELEPGQAQAGQVLPTQVGACAVGLAFHVALVLAQNVDELSRRHRGPRAPNNPYSFVQAPRGLSRAGASRASLPSPW